MQKTRMAGVGNSLRVTCQIPRATLLEGVEVLPEKSSGLMIGGDDPGGSPIAVNLPWMRIIRGPFGRPLQRTGQALTLATAPHADWADPHTWT
jgi:hypothetical protein